MGESLTKIRIVRQAFQSGLGIGNGLLRQRRLEITGPRSDSLVLGLVVAPHPVIVGGVVRLAEQGRQKVQMGLLEIALLQGQAAATHLDVTTDQCGVGRFLSALVGPFQEQVDASELIVGLDVQAI